MTDIQSPCTDNRRASAVTAAGHARSRDIAQIGRSNAHRLNAKRSSSGRCSFSGLAALPPPPRSTHLPIAQRSDRPPVARRPGTPEGLIWMHLVHRRMASRESLGVSLSGVDSPSPASRSSPPVARAFNRLVIHNMWKESVMRSGLRRLHVQSTYRVARGPGK